MIVRVLDSGRYMPGLVRYLVGPGKANEHAEPHVLAASGSLAEEFAGTEWDPAKAGELANVLDGSWREARRAAGLTVVPEPGERAGGGAVNPAHVFHVSLSLGAEEGRLTDEQWAAIARDYVAGMDFTAAGGKAECQWAAFRHGLSSNGNDHIHVAVCLVREDGTRASDWKSKSRSRQVADGIEAKFGLRPVKDVPGGRGLPGYTPGEAAKAERLGRDELDRDALARRVRAAAATSRSEAEFVRTCRNAGLLVRPRYAHSSTEVVEGYSVALRPTGRERPVWFGGSRLDRNLGLPTLRCGWENSAQSARAGVEEWRRAGKARRVSTGRAPTGRQSSAPDPARFDARRDAARAIAGVNARLAAVDPADRFAWRQAAQEAAGVFAAWSLRVEGARPGPLARASDTLARSAQPPRGERPAVSAAGTGMGGRQLSLLARASGPRSAAGWLAVLRQLDRTTQAIHDAHAARGEAIRARQIAAAAGRGLGELRDQLAAAAPLPAPAPADRRAEAPRHHDPHRPRAAPGRYPAAGSAQVGEDRDLDRE